MTVKVSAFLLRFLLASCVCLGLASPGRAQVVAHPAPLPNDAFFDDATLHEIRLTINGKDWQTLKDTYKENTYYPSDFEWRGQTGPTIPIVRNVGIRSRGNATRSNVKPGLRVDFDRYTTNQTFLGLKSFVLRNNATDFTNLHESVAMAFLRRVGEPAPRVAHTRLFVNNAYVGLYDIVEAIDKAFLTRNFSENDGYLYKYDRNPGDDPYYLQYLGPDQALYVPHPFAPETHDTDPKPQPIVDMIRTIAEASDANFRSAIAQYIDLNAFIRQVAAVVFLADNDGFLGNWGMNNFEIYRLQNKNLHVLLPWDKSESAVDGPEYSVFHNITDVPAAQRNRLMSRVLAFPDLRNLYLDTLLACANVADGWMEQEVEREYQLIRDATVTDPQKTYTDDQFNDAIENFKKFARQRSSFVRDEVARSR